MEVWRPWKRPSKPVKPIGKPSAFITTRHRLVKNLLPSTPCWKPWRMKNSWIWKIPICGNCPYMTKPCANVLSMPSSSVAGLTESSAMLSCFRSRLFCLTGLTKVSWKGTGAGSMSWWSWKNVSMLIKAIYWTVTLTWSATGVFSGQRRSTWSCVSWSAANRMMHA